MFTLLVAAFSMGTAALPVAPVWHGSTPRDLHREYNNIFRYGNRNAASHLWSSFVFERAAHMTAEKFESVSSGYCAVSGSPVSPSDYTRYLLRLQSVESAQKLIKGYMYYCCVSDTQALCVACSLVHMESLSFSLPSSLPPSFVGLCFSGLVCATRKTLSGSTRAT